MNFLSLKSISFGAIIIASAAAPVLTYLNSQAKIRAVNESLQEQAAQLVQQSAENQRLTQQAAETKNPQELSDKELVELLGLRNEVGLLRKTAAEKETLQATKERLVEIRKNAEEKARREPTPDPRTVLAYWPKNQLAFAGYTDPQAALKTIFWAMNNGDLDTLKASEYIPRQEKAAKSEAEMTALRVFMADSMAPVTGFSLVGQTMTSQAEATLDVYFEGEGKTRKVTMKKSGNEWGIGATNSLVLW